MKKFTLNLKKCTFIMIGALFMAFSVHVSFDEHTAYVQNLLKEHYDEGLDEALVKRYELNVTNTGFCRYKRYFKSGKVEYFSFNLKQFKDIDYYGNEKNGKLYLRTKGEDVIVQTYNDRKEGDVDSMATCMSIPLKNIAPDDLNGLQERLVKMNAQLLAQK